MRHGERRLRGQGPQKMQEAENLDYSKVYLYRLGRKNEGGLFFGRRSAKSPRTRLRLEEKNSLVRKEGIIRLPVL